MAEPLNVLDLFSGIGGFSLGLQRADTYRPVAFCEINPYCRSVLAKHWPGVPHYDDVRTLTAERLAADGISVDVICGGFPCQDISEAGAKLGLDGERSGLWVHIARLAGELRPKLLFVENVSNLLSGPPEQPGAWFGKVLGDLAEIGYDAEWHSIPASYIGAHHERDRVWIVAYPGGEQHQGGGHALWGTLAAQLLAALADADGEGPSQRSWQDPERTRPVQRSIPAGADEWSSEPDVGRVVYGVPARMERIAALGNAVVPPLVEIIGRAAFSILSRR